MRNYINKHQYGNATANDLISALAEQSGQGERFTRAMKSFLDQPGVPLLNTSLQQEGNKVFLNVKQSRYLPVGSKVMQEASGVYHYVYVMKFQMQVVKCNVNW